MSLLIISCYPNYPTFRFVGTYMSRNLSAFISKILNIIFLYQFNCFIHTLTRNPSILRYHSTTELFFDIYNNNNKE